MLRFGIQSTNYLLIQSIVSKQYVFFLRNQTETKFTIYLRTTLFNH